jgi:hypothetical protein
VRRERDDELSAQDAILNPGGKDEQAVSGGRSA